MSGFKFVKSRSGGRDILRKRQIAASATVVAGDALEVTDGKFKRVSAAGDTVVAIAAESATSTATSLTKIKLVEVFGNIFEVGITPLIDDVAANSGSTTTALVALTDGSSSDLVGGTIYVNGEQRIISANTYSSNVVTITWLEPIADAVASGDLVRVVPFGLGTLALKLHASNFYNSLSSAIADITGGKVAIDNVDLEKKVAHVYFV